MCSGPTSLSLVELLKHRLCQKRGVMKWGQMWSELGNHKQEVTLTFYSIHLTCKFNCVQTLKSRSKLCKIGNLWKIANCWQIFNEYWHCTIVFIPLKLLVITISSLVLTSQLDGRAGKDDNYAIWLRYPIIVQSFPAQYYSMPIFK